MVVDALSMTLAAVADPTRRSILQRLTQGPATVVELTAPFEVSQQAISKHLKVLERAGLIARARDAQRRPCWLQAKPLAEASAWLEGYREFWETTFQRLDPCSRSSKPTRNNPSNPEKRKRPMKQTQNLKVTTPTDREILITRAFDAPRKLVFEAYTKPELVKRWLLGPPGWTMPVCEIDLKVGGAYRYVWEKQGTTMGMGGIYKEIKAPERLVCTERFDESWYPGEAVDTLVLTEQGGKTTLNMTVRYESQEARDTALKSNMEEGMAAGFDRLADLLASQAKGK
jgi:uncharacterized protein YndB with AHSA1/START domain/DNA-binding transcriptional ArsR family regulator